MEYTAHYGVKCQNHRCT